jgi:hypothetical protein
MHKLTFLTLLAAGCLFAQAPPPYAPLAAPGYTLGQNTVFNAAPGQLILPVPSSLPATCSTGQIVVTGGKLHVCISNNSWVDFPEAFSSITGLLSPAQLPNIITSNTSGNSATATNLFAMPAQCGHNQFATGIASNGNANCSAITGSQVSGLAASAFEDTTSASNILSGVLSPLRLPAATPNSMGAILGVTAVPHEWIDSIGSTGTPHLSQPTVSDIQGLTLGAIATGADVVKLFGSGNCNGFLKNDLSCVNIPTTAPTTAAGGENSVQFNADGTHFGAVINNGSKAFLTQTSGQAPTFAHIAASDLPSQIASNTTGNSATASALAAAPSLCQTGQVASGIKSDGTPVCVSVPATAVSGLAPSATTNALDADNINTGTIAPARLPSSVPTGVTNDTNIQAQIQNGSLVLTWAGTLAPSRLNSTVPETVDSDANITGTIADQTLTLGFNGQLPITRGGTGASTTSQAFDTLSPTKTAGDLIYFDGSTNKALAGNKTTATQYLCETGTGTAPSAPSWCTLQPSETVPASSVTGILSPTQLPLPTTSTLGGVEANTPVAHQFLTAIDSAGVVHAAQPTATDINGLSQSATIDTTNAANILTGILSSSRLPLPTGSSLGGVQALAPTAHQFVTGISATTGAPITSTLHVADIADFPSPSTTVNAAQLTGSIPAASLPAPTISSAGGVMALNPVTHEFVTGIDNTGTPILARPTAGDIQGLAASATTDTTNAANILSGILTPARLPSSVLMNNVVDIYVDQAAPSSPPTTAGTAEVWVDQSSKNLRVLSDANGLSMTVQPFTAPTHQFVTGVSSSGAFASAQVQASDVNGLAQSALTDTTNAANIKTGTIAAQLLPSMIASSTTGNAQTASAFDHQPTACSSGQVANGINPDGSPNCVTVPAAWVTGLAPSATIDTTNASNIKTGTLSSELLEGNVVTSCHDDLNVTCNIQQQELFLGWQGTLAANRLNPNVVQSVVNDPNIVGDITDQTLTLSWGGLLSQARGGTGGYSKSTGFDALAPTTGLGDLIYNNGTTNVRLAGSTATSTRYLCETGTGVLSSAPTWCAGTSGGGGGGTTLTSIPDPTYNTLGGIEAIQPIAHQWVTYLDENGSLHLAQPTAADVQGLAASATTDTTNASNINAGTLAAARLPLPTISSIGGVEANAPMAHQYLTYLDATGLLHTAQPSAADVTGLAPSATIDTTNANNLLSGVIPAARFPLTIASNTSGNAATATALAATPTGCATNQFAVGISANGTANCSSVSYSQITGTMPTPTLKNVPATDIADGSVTNQQFEYLDGATSNIQNQINTLSFSAYDGCDGVPSHLFGILPTNTDNYAAFQTAFSELSSYNNNYAGGIICLEGGTYYTSNTIIVPSKVQIRGRGRGDGPATGSANSVISATSGFPANAPVIQYGVANQSNTATFGTRISNMAILCNGSPGSIGIQDNFGEEQSGGDHISVFSCGGSSLQVNGADFPSTGSVQNQYGWHDMELFTGTATTASTVPLEINDEQEGGGYDRISIVGTPGYEYNYCAMVSGNNLHIESIHCEDSKDAAIYVGPPNQGHGMLHLFIDNVVQGYNAAGPAVELGAGATNQNTGITIMNASSTSNLSHCGTVQNDVTGTCTSPSFYVLGDQGSGNATVIDTGYDSTWQLYNGTVQWRPYINYNQAGGYNINLGNAVTFKQWPFTVNQDGSLDIGDGGVDGATDIHFHNPGGKFCLNSDGAGDCSELNFQGPLEGNFGVGMFDNAFYNSATGLFQVIGNGSGYVSAVLDLNPGGSLGLAPVYGGVGIISQQGVNPGTYTPAQWAQFMHIIFPGQGGIQFVNSTNLPGCTQASDDGKMYFLQGASGVADTLKVCSKNASNAYGWTTVF